MKCLTLLFKCCKFKYSKLQVHVKSSNLGNHNLLYVPVSQQHLLIFKNGKKERFNSESFGFKAKKSGGHLSD